ncbi:uncharacterized protein LOC143213257 [Lasioglossum baleicum]|uniref:uncharacterized protein LOC143213257 n=1 Tax=Lasioglossum baleicum TaxID=434251 RepID=UPI003FCD2893
MTWKLDVEFDDAPRCVLYDQIFFSVETTELAAPPASPVEGLKYAPLAGERKRSTFAFEDDVFDSLHSLWSYGDTRDQLRSLDGVDSRGENVANFKRPNNVLGTGVPLSLRYVGACNKEKLEFTEESRATKSFSEGSIFLKGGIDDVNEAEQSKVSRDRMARRCPRRSWLHLWKPGKTVRSEVSFNLSSEVVSSEGDSLENKSKECWRSNIVLRNNIGDGCADLQCPRRVQNPSRTLAEYTLTKTDKTRSITKRSSVSFMEGKDILSKLWDHALLANRSSNNSCLSADSLYHNNPASYTRYRPERHTFLRRASIVQNNNRRVLNPSRIFDFAKCLTRDPRPCESRPTFK